MKLINVFCLFIFITYSTVGIAQNTDAGSTEEFIMQAQAALNDGKFTKAAEYYEAAILAGHTNGHVFYNYGIALWRSGEKGKSMAAFMAAKKYLPRNPDVNANLKHIHDQTVDELGFKFERPVYAIPFFWIGSLTLREQFLLFSWIFMFALCFVAIQQYRPKWPVWKYASIGSGVISIVLLSGLVLSLNLERPVGAVSAEKTEAFSGPSTKSHSVVFELNEGAPFQVEEDVDEWIKVKLSDGKKGWISKENVTFFEFGDNFIPSLMCCKTGVM